MKESDYITDKKPTKTLMIIEKYKQLAREVKLVTVMMINEEMYWTRTCSKPITIYIKCIPIIHNESH